MNLKKFIGQQQSTDLIHPLLKLLIAKLVVQVTKISQAEVHDKTNLGRHNSTFLLVAQNTLEVHFALKHQSYGDQRQYRYTNIFCPHTRSYEHKCPRNMELKAMNQHKLKKFCIATLLP